MKPIFAIYLLLLGCATPAPIEHVTAKVRGNRTYLYDAQTGEFVGSFGEDGGY
jgi:hypothetical protein